MVYLEARNDIIFKSQPLHPPILQKIIQAMHEWNMAVVTFRDHHPGRLLLESWTPPRTAVHKLNVDGSFNHEIGTAGIGGI